MYKKNIMIALLLSLSTMAIAAPQSLPQEVKSPINEKEQPKRLVWMSNYEAALKKAGEKNSGIFLFFTGSNWCGWCQKLDSQILQSKEFIKELREQMVFVEIDFPNPRPANFPRDLQMQNDALRKQYNITAYPTVIILDSQGNQLARTGYRTADPQEYIQFLKGILGNSANCLLREGQR